ncbi:hypothetical protein Cs7R123_42750 [Catellatospora sp. TT07R-123]|uniref:YbaB/EbfC family nucleoid-associated protein n=1 Tax=Catellatospora sp. TT07R-123 TaxID=2733863 RepID=UPI001B08570A|nr:YbaB/EbfC family nucleoid-associated protein [Catellatospora sp. TT07R-123]GHJ46933.1 hypothetical protein Cs7R123_42750 [Catellatospora sp. TT07R-123]
MTAADRGLEQAAADYARHRAFAIEAHRRMAAVSATMTSPQGLVTATVGAQGELRALTFNSQDYRRMAPAELARTVLDTVARARQSVLQQLLGELPEAPVGGLSVRDLMEGTADLERLLPERLDLDGLPFTRRPGGHGL